MGERSLVLFTLLAQTACGALIGLAGVQLLGTVDVLGPLPFIAVGLLLLAAVAISTLHLGAPQHALRSIANWRRSWLSREIMGLGVTGSLVALGALTALLGAGEGSEAVRTLLAVLAAAAGSWLVATMVQLYSVRTVPEWRRPRTAGAFAGTTLRLGSVGAAILATVGVLPDGSIGGATAWMLLMLGVGTGLWLVVASRRPGAGATRTRAGALLVRGRIDSGGLERRAARWSAIGAVAAAAGIVVLAIGPALLAAVVLAVALGVMAVGELDARERFYEAAPSRSRDLSRAAAPTRAASPD